MTPSNNRNAPLLPPQGLPIYYQGASLDKGPQPALIFFALSAQTSLFVDPFNQAVNLLVDQQKMRVFSWDIPHHGLGKDPHEAMKAWAQDFANNPSFIAEFIQLCQAQVNYLVQQGYVEATRLAVAGLSRGGLLATHLAAQDSRFKTILGFAPLTDPHPLDPLASSTTYEQITLTSLVKKLIHTSLRFYIGNNDTRVSTDACYHFIRTLTKTAFAQDVRSPQIELILYPSVGYLGHGTPPHIFQDGAEWIKRQLLPVETL